APASRRPGAGLLSGWFAAAERAGTQAPGRRDAGAPGTRARPRDPAEGVAMTAAGASVPGPLAGLRVIDLTGECGQYCGRLLAGLGADVVKVEPPGGDPVRRLGPFLDDDPARGSLTWAVLNAGKRGVVLDPNLPADRQRLDALIAGTDIVLESYTSAELDRLGLDPEAYRRRSPGLIWVSITGYGRSGPCADWEWTDLVLQAMGGLAFICGDTDRPPVRMGADQAYFHLSAQAAVGALIALWERGRSGEGQVVDVSGQEALLLTLEGGALISYYLLEDLVIGRTGTVREKGYYQHPAVLPCKDGYVSTGIPFGTRFSGLLKILAEDGLDRELSDPKWLTAAEFSPGPWLYQATQADWDKVFDVIRRWALTRTKAEAYEQAVQHGIFLCPVNSAKDLAESAQLRAREFLDSYEDPLTGRKI